jgi:hypothetical protein
MRDKWRSGEVERMTMYFPVCLCYLRVNKRVKGKTIEEKGVKKVGVEEECTRRKMRDD